MIRYSIVMPCYNEAHVLHRSLASIRQAIGERTDVELLVLDNGSTDDSVAIAGSYGATVHPLPGVKISALRNKGAALSQGHWLLFLDADVQVPPDWLETVDHYVDQQLADVVGFVDDVPATAPWYARIWGLRARARRQTLKTVDALPGRNLLVAKTWFEKVNGFNEQLQTGEDKDFVMRLSKAGAKVVSDPSLTMIHLGFERTFAEWCRKEYWRQHSHMALLQEQGVSLRLLRFPLISVAHLLWSCVVLLCLLSGTGLIRALILWFVPALLMSLANPLSRSPLNTLGQFTLLYWLRFHIAGYSVIQELRERRTR